jgi:hypothetical protein
MDNMTLQCKEGSDFKPHPEGIHPAVCLDVIDLGLVETEFQGQRRMVNKLKVVFESELRMEDGKPFTISKNFTASLHPKARLAEFIGKWRGRLVVPGETIDLTKLVGACCTLVVSHQQNMVGRTYASIDAISKPTRKVVPSGAYDPAVARQRIADWRARQLGSNQSTVISNQPGGRSQGGNSPQPAYQGGQGVAPAPFSQSGVKPPQSTAPVAAETKPAGYDDELGF